MANRKMSETIDVEDYRLFWYTGWMRQKKILERDHIELAEVP